MSAKYVGLSLLLMALALLSMGCGAASSMSNTSNNPPAATPPAASSQPGGGSSSPGAGSSGAGSSGTANPSSDSYMATMFAANSDGTASAFAPPLGTVTVDDSATDGRGTLKIAGSLANTSYELRFCPGSDTQPVTTNCTSIVSYSTGTSGSANVMFQVPPGPSSSSGYHVGSFYVFQNGNAVYVGGSNAQVAGRSFRAAVLPQCCGNLPPGGGSVTASGQSIHVALTGVPASMSYEVLLCVPTPFGRRCNSFGTNTVDVDAQGNGAKDFSLTDKTFIGLVLIKNHLGQNYDTGFRVQ